MSTPLPTCMPSGPFNAGASSCSSTWTPEDKRLLVELVGGGKGGEAAISEGQGNHLLEVEAAAFSISHHTLHSTVVSIDAVSVTHRTLTLISYFRIFFRLDDLFPWIISRPQQYVIMVM